MRACAASLVVPVHDVHAASLAQRDAGRLVRAQQEDAARTEDDGGAERGENLDRGAVRQRGEAGEAEEAGCEGNDSERGEGVRLAAQPETKWGRAVGACLRGASERLRGAHTDTLPRRAPPARSPCPPPPRTL